MAVRNSQGASGLASSQRWGRPDYMDAAKCWFQRILADPLPLRKPRWTSRVFVKSGKHGDVLALKYISLYIQCTDADEISPRRFESWASAIPVDITCHSCSLTNHNMRLCRQRESTVYRLCWAAIKTRSAVNTRPENFPFTVFILPLFHPLYLFCGEEIGRIDIYICFFLPSQMPTLALWGFSVRGKLGGGEDIPLTLVSQVEPPLEPASRQRGTKGSRGGSCRNLSPPV